MIKAVEIENFQSHKFTRLEFVPGVNVIIGQSDSGKSAILRALYWVFWNKPLGFEFKSRFSSPKDPTRVKVEFDNGWVERYRDHEDNKYIVDGEEFKALGGKVPEEVLSLINLEDFNFQTQFENYFLLQDSPGEVARKLNQVVGLDIIDKVLSTSNSLINETKLSINRLTEEVDSLQEKLSFYKGLKEIEKKLLLLEQKIEEFDRIKVESETLRRLVSNYKEVSEELSRIPNLKESDLEEIDFLKERWLRVSNRRDQLKSLIESFLKVLEDQKNLCLIDLDEVEDLFQELKSKIEGFQFLLEDIEVLEDKVYDLERLSEDLLSLEGKEDQVKKEFKSILSEVEFCPLCGSKLKDRNLLKEWLLL